MSQSIVGCLLVLFVAAPTFVLIFNSMFHLCAAGGLLFLSSFQLLITAAMGWGFGNFINTKIGGAVYSRTGGC